MKELIGLLLITFACGLLYASAEYIIAIPTASFNTTDLQENIRNLADSGLEIYYYNENQVIAGSSTSFYPQAKLLCLANSGTMTIAPGADDNASGAAAMHLQSHIGEQYNAIVTGASPKGTWVRTLHPPVEGKLVNGFEGLDVGHKLRVQLLRADVQCGFIDFKRA